MRTIGASAGLRAFLLMFVVATIAAACGGGAQSDHAAAPGGGTEQGLVAAVGATTSTTLGASTVAPTTLPEPIAEDVEAEPYLTRRSARLTDYEPSNGPVPVGLRIEQLSVDAPIRPVGVEQGSGDMEVVNNVRDVGWYEFGSRPGEPGSAVLAAHVDLAGQGPGVFFDLRDLSHDAEIVVIFDDDSERRFRVVDNETVKKPDVDLEAIFTRDGDSLLTLVTCGGGFNRSIARYDSNVIVTAVPIEEGAG